MAARPGDLRGEGESQLSARKQGEESLPQFRVVSSKRILRCGFLEVARERAQGPKNLRIEKHVVKHAGAAAVIARDPNGMVLLIRQYRLPVRQSLWELPAGRLGAGERPLSAAKRELAEETGYRARAWRKLFVFYPSPGFCDERMTVYLAEGLTEGQPHPEPYELIRTRWVAWDEALRMVTRGRIKDAKTIAGLLYADTVLQ